MYYKQVKLDDAAQKVYDQLRVVVAKNRPDPDVFIEQLRQILNANSLIRSINNGLQAVIDDDPTEVDKIADVDDAIEIFANQTDSDGKSDDWHDELDRASHHLELVLVGEDQLERDQ